MFCKYCGSQIEDGAQFCPNCGSATERPSAPGGGNSQPYYQQPTYQQPTSTSNTIALVGFILSFFVTLPGLICSIIGYRRAPEYGGNGRGLALAGIIISSVAIGLTILFVIIYIVAFIPYIQYGVTVSAI